MTIDVNLCRADENFLENLDDIMEESMVQMFILHPSNPSEIEETKALAEDTRVSFTPCRCICTMKRMETVSHSLL